MESPCEVQGLDENLEFPKMVEGLDVIAEGARREEVQSQVEEVERWIHWELIAL